MKNLEKLSFAELRDLRNELGKAIVESEQEARMFKNPIYHERFKAKANVYRDALEEVRNILRRKLDEIIGIEEGGDV
jgi:TATA-binding protein-associated factor Taf7